MLKNKKTLLENPEYIPLKHVVRELERELDQRVGPQGVYWNLVRRDPQKEHQLNDRVARLAAAYAALKCLDESKWRKLQNAVFELKRRQEAQLKLF